MLSKLVGQSGEVEFNAVISESVEMSNRITAHAVEDGQDVADHVSPEPDGLPITGVIVGDDAPQKLAKLREFRNNAELLTFVGRNIMANVVIESLVTRHNARTRDGFEFDITLRRVRIAQVQEVQIAAPSNLAGLRAETQTKQVQNKGRQQPKRKEPFFIFQPRRSA